LHLNELKSSQKLLGVSSQNQKEKKKKEDDEEKKRAK